MGFDRSLPLAALIRFVALAILSTPATALPAHPTDTEKPGRGSGLCFTTWQEGYSLLGCYERSGPGIGGEVFGDESTYITLVPVLGNMSTVASCLGGCAMAVPRDTASGDYSYVAVSQGRYAVSGPRNITDAGSDSRGIGDVAAAQSSRSGRGRSTRACATCHARATRTYLAAVAPIMRSFTLSTAGPERTRPARPANPRPPCHARHRRRPPPRHPRAAHNRQRPPPALPAMTRPTTTSPPASSSPLPTRNPQWASSSAPSPPARPSAAWPSSSYSSTGGGSGGAPSLALILTTGRRESTRRRDAASGTLRAAGQRGRRTGT